MIEIEARNPTEAAPNLLRFLVAEGQHEGELIVATKPVRVTYREPCERVIGWLDWPDSPLDIFCEAVDAVSTRPRTISAPSGQSGAILYNLPKTDVQRLLGSLTTELSLYQELYAAEWFRHYVPMQRLTLEVHGLTCRKRLLQEAGMLLLEVSKVTSYPGRIRATQDTVADLEMFSNEGCDAIGYKSAFMRRVVIPMFQAREAVKAEGLPAALPILDRAYKTDWVEMTRQWIQYRS